MEDTEEMKEKKENYEAFKKQLPDLLKDIAYKNKYVIVSNKEIQGVFDTFENAFKEAKARFPSESFIIQEVFDENEQVNVIQKAI